MRASGVGAGARRRFLVLDPISIDAKQDRNLLKRRFDLEPSRLLAVSGCMRRWRSDSSLEDLSMAPKRSAAAAEAAETAAENKRYRQVMNEMADELVCSITQELPVDPVMAEDGRVYERQAMEEWLHRHAGQHRADAGGPLPRAVLDAEVVAPVPGAEGWLVVRVGARPSRHERARPAQARWNHSSR